MEISRDPFFGPNKTLTRFETELSLSRIRIVVVQEKFTPKCSLDILKKYFLFILLFFGDHTTTETATVSLNYLRINQLNLMRQTGQPHLSQLFIKYLCFICPQMEFEISLRRSPHSVLSHFSPIQIPANYF